MPQNNALSGNTLRVALLFILPSIHLGGGGHHMLFGVGSHQKLPYLIHLHLIMSIVFSWSATQIFDGLERLASNNVVIISIAFSISFLEEQNP